MQRPALIFVAANVALVGALAFQLYTGHLSEKNLFVAGTICFFAINLLLYWRLRRGRK